MTSVSMSLVDNPLKLINLKRWSVDDYHRMSELGILDSQQQTELIAGQVTIMAAKGTPHVTALHLLANILRDRLGHDVLVRTQDPIHLDNFSEPEPDLVVVRGNILDYAQQHPRPEQIYLVVEISDSTLKQDCEIKDKIYAQAGITDYWVLAIKSRQLHIFRKPTPMGYTEELILTEPNQASLLAFPNIVITRGSILPPLL